MSTDVVSPLRQRMIEDMNARKLGTLSPPRARATIWRQLSNNIIQKGLEIAGDWSGTVCSSGRDVRFGILPRRPGGRGGASVVRRMASR